MQIQTVKNLCSSIIAFSTSLVQNFTFLLLLFFSACSETCASSIATIPEASGISYCEESNTLVVANDEGFFYELTTSGDILSYHKLGEYDLEGVVCNKKSFMFAVEDGVLLKVNRKTLKKKEFKIKGEGFKLSKKHGIEGICKIKNVYYVTIQSKKKENQAKLLKLNIGANYAKVIKVITHNIIDSAGLEWRDNKLYIISDKKDKLYIYDLKRNKILKKIKLPRFAQEGITFDNKSNVYFADDDGRVLKYSVDTLKKGL